MEKEMIITSCPSCNALVVIDPSEVNCKIFRHGVMKDTGTQIDPHLAKEGCDKLAAEGLIYGCGKPFKLERKDSTNWEAVLCDYI